MEVIGYPETRMAMRYTHLSVIRRMIKGQEHIQLTLEEVHDLFETTDEDEIQDVIMEMINLELRDPERPDSRGVRVFLGASGRLEAEGDEPVVELTINDRALELYNT